MFHNFIGNDDEELLKLMKEWKCDFFIHKGFNALFKIYVEISKKEVLKTHDE